MDGSLVGCAAGAGVRQAPYSSHSLPTHPLLPCSLIPHPQEAKLDALRSDLISRHAEDVKRRTEAMKLARESELQGLEAMLRSEFQTKLAARENELKAKLRDAELEIETLRGKLQEMKAEQKRTVRDGGGRGDACSVPATC